MQTFKISGKVESVGETKAYGENGFLKRDVIVNTAEPNAMYPSPVPFSLKKDKCALADSLRVGDEVEITFTIDGRRWDGPYGTKHFVDLTAWKIDTIDAAPAPVSEPDPEGVRKPIDEVWEAWKERNGDNAADFCNFMDTACPDLAARKKSTGKKYSELCTDADARVLLGAIANADMTAAESDLPF